MEYNLYKEIKFDDFRNGLITINCRTDYEAKEFLKYCSEHGITDSMNSNIGDKDYDDCWHVFKQETCYDCSEGDNIIRYSNTSYEKNSCRRIITYQQLKYKLEIINKKDKLIILNELLNIELDKYNKNNNKSSNKIAQEYMKEINELTKNLNYTIV